VRHRGILGHRVERGAGNLEHRRAAEALGDARTVPSGKLAHLGVVAIDDEANGVGAAGGNPVGQIAREPGAVPGVCAHGAKR
jgi:hypothetical protein